MELEEESSPACLPPIKCPSSANQRWSGEGAWRQRPIGGRATSPPQAEVPQV